MVGLSKEEGDRLFVGSAPLSSFSAKIQVAYAIGLIGPKATHDLDRIREIRNAFAHAKVSITFDTDAVANTINGLHFRKLSADWNDLSTQMKFATVVRFMLVYLIALWTEQQTPEMREIRQFDIPVTPVKFA
jgi:DNA-binding MltR family transcriptional regulator